MRPDSLLRLWRYIKHLLTYLLTYLHTIIALFAETNVSSPSFAWFSGESLSVLLGQNLSLECVAQGVPAPQLVWKKYGGVLPTGRHSLILGAYVVYRQRT